MNEESLYALFNGISKGFSPIFYNGEELFIKHPTVSDFAFFEFKRGKELDRLKEEGGKTREEIIEQMKTDGCWDFDKDKSIELLNAEIESSKVYLKAQTMKARISATKIKIKKAQDQVAKLSLEQEMSLTHEGVDSIVASRSNIEFILSSLYKRDKKTKYFDEKMLDELTEEDCSEISNMYMEYKDSYSNENIQCVSVAEFFKPYYMFCESCQEFFGQPAKDLTQHQVSLLYFAKTFKTIFENYSENIPKEYENDPEAIIDCVEAANHSKQSMQRDEQKLDKHGNLVMSTKFGSSREEMSAANGVNDFADIKALVGESGGLTGEELAKKIIK